MRVLHPLLVLKYNVMVLSELFLEEIELIQDEEINDFVVDFLINHTPEEFGTKPASSSLKYHPAECRNIEKGGGLVLHTKYVVRACQILLEATEFNQYWKDVCIAACILHDAFKYGKDGTEKHTIGDHAQILSEYICTNYPDWKCMDIAMCIRSHMGKWTGYHIELMNEYQKVVHYADMIASRLDTIDKEIRQ